MSMKKAVCSLLAAAIITVPVSVNRVSMAVSADVTICDVNTNYCSSDLSLSGTTAKCNSTVVGYNGKTTKIVINQILQKKTSSGSWSNYKSANTTVNASKGSLYKTYSGLSKGTYRLSTSATVYAGNKREVVTRYSSTRTVK